MSYDLRVSFPQPSFPFADWHAVLDLFDWVGDRAKFGTLDEWHLEPDRGHTLWASLEACSPAAPDLCSPLGTRWRLHVSTNSGRSQRTWHAQFSLAYHVLTLIPGTSVHDCQHHLSVSLEESSFKEPATFAAFAADTHRLWRLDQISGYH